MLYRSNSIHGQAVEWFVCAGRYGFRVIFGRIFDPETGTGLDQGRADRAQSHDQAGRPARHRSGMAGPMPRAETPHVSAADGVLYWRPGGIRRLPSYARMVVFAGPQKLSNWRVKRYSPWVEEFYPGPKIDPTPAATGGSGHRAG